MYDPSSRSTTEAAPLRQRPTISKLINERFQIQNQKREIKSKRLRKTVKEKKKKGKGLKRENALVN